MKENTLKNKIEGYFVFCKARKNLDSKTIKSYSTDLQQFHKYITTKDLIWNEKNL